MGAMGNAIKRVVTKPFRTFNVDNRAQRVIAKDKPKVAPRHINYQDATPLEHQAEIRQKVASKSEELHDRLRDVSVVSEGKNPEIPRMRVAMPTDRSTYEDPESGYHEPKVIPIGKISLSQATSMLTKHTAQPLKYGAQDAAQEYKLDLADAERILRYFKPMQVLDLSDKKATDKFIKENAEEVPPPLSYEETHKKLLGKKAKLFFPEPNVESEEEGGKTSK